MKKENLNKQSIIIGRISGHQWGIVVSGGYKSYAYCIATQVSTDCDQTMEKEKVENAEVKEGKASDTPVSGSISGYANILKNRNGK